MEDAKNISYHCGEIYGQLAIELLEDSKQLKTYKILIREPEETRYFDTNDTVKGYNYKAASDLAAQIYKNYFVRLELIS